MTPEQIREIALQCVEDLLPRGRTYSPDVWVDFATRFLAEIQKASEPVAWVTGGDCYEDGHIDCYAWTTGEFTAPLYTVPPTPAVPDDMVLVPREPTEEMIKAVMPKHYGVVEKYKAMIAAAEGKK